MTKYDKELEAERLREIEEHNKKIITEHFHLDHDKWIRKNIERLGEYYANKVVEFSDKERRKQIG